jgi:Family of unknown function (DUF6744)
LTPKSPLAGYGAGIRKETLLGWVAWYGISDPTVEYDALKERVIDLGLDVSAMPAPLRPGDSFKRACRYAEQKKVPYGDVFTNIMIRSVAQDNETVERQLVVEIVDADDKRLEYESAARLILDKYEYTLSWTAKNNRAMERTFAHKQSAIDLRTKIEETPGFDPKTGKLRLSVSEEPTLIIERFAWSDKLKNYKLVDAALETFEAEYEKARTYLDAQTIRQMVRRQLDLMRAFLLRRNGSVYFIPGDQESQAVALCDLLDWISADSGFHILPLIDTAKQREMIQAAFEDEVHESAQAMLNILSEALHNEEAVTSAAWVDFMNKKEALQARAVEYSDLIDREFIKAGTELTLLDETMTELLKKGLVKESRSKK